MDWWFAYTAGTADYLIRHGVPQGKITNLQNSIGTTAFRQKLESTPESELATVHRKLGISENAKVRLFCSGVTRGRMAEFLVEPAVGIKGRAPEFELLVIGAGSEQIHFERAAADQSWFHYLGPRFGREKALYFGLSEVFLMPGVIGLTILDAFTAGPPVVTTDLPTHGPEIECLEPGHNGLVTPCDAGNYASGGVHVLNQPEALRRLQAGALSSAQQYSIGTMVEDLLCGVLQCLQMSPRPAAKRSDESRVRGEEPS